jgi:hypothetical protein
MSEFTQHILYYLPSLFITGQRGRCKRGKRLLFFGTTFVFVFLYAETFQRLDCSLNIIKCLVFGYEVFLFYSFLIARFNFISSKLYKRGE